MDGDRELHVFALDEDLELAAVPEPSRPGNPLAEQIWLTEPEDARKRPLEQQQPGEADRHTRARAAPASPGDPRYGSSPGGPSPPCIGALYSRTPESRGTSPLLGQWPGSDQSGSLPPTPPRRRSGSGASLWGGSDVDEAPSAEARAAALGNAVRASSLREALSAAAAGAAPIGGGGGGGVLPLTQENVARHAAATGAPPPPPVLPLAVAVPAGCNTPTPPSPGPLAAAGLFGGVNSGRRGWLAAAASAQTANTGAVRADHGVIMQDCAAALAPQHRHRFETLRRSAPRPIPLPSPTPSLTLSPLVSRPAPRAAPPAPAWAVPPGPGGAGLARPVALEPELELEDVDMDL